MSRRSTNRGVVGAVPRDPARQIRVVLMSGENGTYRVLARSRSQSVSPDRASHPLDMRRYPDAIRRLATASKPKPATRSPTPYAASGRLVRPVLAREPL